jgi:hypothetical protein
MQAQYSTSKEMNTLLAPSRSETATQKRPQPIKQGTLQILEATYGAGDVQIDVTQKVQTAIANGQTNICPSNSFFGTDPVFGKVKKLSVSFVQGGNLYQTTVREGELLSFAVLERIIGSNWSSS